MFFIAKQVADGIKALRRRENVEREIAAIQATPGYEVYARAIAEGAVHRKPRQRSDPAEPVDPPSSTTSATA